MIRSTYPKGPVITLWLLANLFFAFQFILRISISVLQEEIVDKFAIDAAALGQLAGYYYLGYSGSQIPLGIMLDRLSFRLVTSSAIATACLGISIFMYAETWPLLAFGRFLIGVGSGVAFLSIAKITKVCFEEKYHGLLLGVAFSIGLAGATFGLTPMSYLFDQFGYDRVFIALVVTGTVLAISMLLKGKLPLTAQATEDQQGTASTLISLLCNPKIIIIGIAGGLMVGTLEGFADLWALPFFQQLFGFSKIQSANITTCLYWGMCLGGPFLAFLATMIRSNSIMILLSAVFTILLWLYLFSLPNLSFVQSAIIMFIFGILCCYQVLVFTLVGHCVPPAVSGIATAITNCLNMSFGYFFHAIIGHKLTTNWLGEVSPSGTVIYTANNFINSLSIIPIGCFFSLFGFTYIIWRLRREAR